MFVRAIPLMICLGWLVYESHFSPSFFVATVETSVNSIMAGLDDVIGGDFPSHFTTAAVEGEAL